MCSILRGIGGAGSGSHGGSGGLVRAYPPAGRGSCSAFVCGGDAAPSRGMRPFLQFAPLPL
eukprot:3649507-Pyramimonas_sp.AAC.1